MKSSGTRTATTKGFHSPLFRSLVFCVWGWGSLAGSKYRSTCALAALPHAVDAGNHWANSRAVMTVCVAAPLSVSESLSLFAPKLASTQRTSKEAGSSARHGRCTTSATATSASCKKPARGGPRAKRGHHLPLRPPPPPPPRLVPRLRSRVG